MGKAGNKHGGCRMSWDGTEGSIGNEGIRSKKSQPGGCDDPADPKTQRIDPLWAEDVAFLQSQHLTLRIISGAFVVELVGLSDGCTVVHVGSIEGVMVTEFLIDSGSPVVLGGGLLSRKIVNPRISPA